MAESHPPSDETGTENGDPTLGRRRFLAATAAVPVFPLARKRTPSGYDTGGYGVGGYGR